MTSIAIHGSYYGYNFGDTLLCRLFSDWARQNGADRTVLPLANERNRNFIGADARGLTATRQSDGFIFCGGGYFSEPRTGVTAWTARAAVRHLMLARWIRTSNRPLAILGVGVGPISNAMARREITSLFAHADIAVVRDEESAAFLREWGLDRDVTIYCDAVAASSLAKHHPRNPSVRSQTPDPTAEAVILAHTSGNPSNMELAALRELCDWTRAKKNGARIAFTTDGLPRRREISWPEQLQSEYADLAPVTFAYDGDIDLLVDRIARAQLVFTTKLHVGIVAASLNRPVISVPHHPKTRRFFRQIDAERLVVDQNRADWRADVQALLDDLFGSTRMEFDRLDELRQHNDYEALIRRFIASVSHHDR